MGCNNGSDFNRWMCAKLKESQKEQRICLNDTEFVPLDVNNPTTEEVKTWCDANLNYVQKNNGTQIVYYVGDYEPYQGDINIYFSAGAEDSSITFVALNGYPIFPRAGHEGEVIKIKEVGIYIYTDAIIKPLIENWLINNGYEGILESPSGETLTISHIKGGLLEVDYGYYEDGDSYIDRYESQAVPMIPGNGGTCDEPDFSWVLNNNEITFLSNKIFKKTIINSKKIIKQISDYDNSFLVGSPTVYLDNSTSEMLNDHNRFIFFDKERSSFFAGRFNNVNDLTPQWSPELCAQYSGTFGWSNLAYGGYNSTKGALCKGQFIAGYENLGFAFAASIIGTENANGSMNSSIIGAENIVVNDVFDFTYDKPNKRFILNGDLTANFPVGRLIGIRVLHPVNLYYTVASGVITSTTLVNGMTFVETNLQNWIDQNFTNGFIWLAEPYGSIKNNHIKGYRNVVNSSNNTYINGMNCVISNRKNIWANGANLEPKINNSYIYGTEKYSSTGEVQTYKLYPLIAKYNDTNKLSLDSIPYISIPNNSISRISISGIVRNVTTNTTINVDGNISITKISNVLTINTSDINDNGALVFNAVSNSGNLEINTSSIDTLLGSFELSINNLLI